MRRLVLVVALAAAVVAGLGAAPARATNECRGLMVCVRVAGPWVVVPRGGAAPRPSVQFQLSCPRGFVVGGTDAELSDRGIDISFRGKLGSPVGPGVTTERAAVFVATYAGSAARTLSFRPHVGCLPTSGGGGGPVPYRPSAAPTVPPDDPAIRRVRTVPLHSGTIHARQGCASGEVLVSGWHAVAFYTAHPPTGALVAAVAAARHIRAGRVDVLAHVTPTVRGVHAILQVGAVCGGGR